MLNIGNGIKQTQLMPLAMIQRHKVSGFIYLFIITGNQRV